MKIELKNLVSLESYGSLKMVCRFHIFEQKMLTSAKLWDPEIVFSKALVMHYHYTKVRVFSLSLSPKIWATSKNDLPPRCTYTDHKP